MSVGVFLGSSVPLTWLLLLFRIWCVRLSSPYLTLSPYSYEDKQVPFSGNRNKHNSSKSSTSVQQQHSNSNTTTTTTKQALTGERFVCVPAK
jgi:hypothetical protein